jgi:hypothetical protein
MHGEVGEQCELLWNSALSQAASTVSPAMASRQASAEPGMELARVNNSCARASSTRRSAATSLCDARATQLTPAPTITSAMRASAPITPWLPARLNAKRQSMTVSAATAPAVHGDRLRRWDAGSSPAKRVDIIRDKSHNKTPDHSIVAEIANAMTNAGHAGRRGISSTSRPMLSAWVRS